MKKIMYNPSSPELIFSVASLLSKLKKEFPDDPCYIIPMDPMSLNEDAAAFMEEVSHELENMNDQVFFDYEKLVGKGELYLIGLHPEDAEEEKEIAFFFNNNQEQITLWVDNHHWPDNLLSFLNGRPEKVSIDESSTCLKILSKLGYPNCPEWEETEDAINRFDRRNPLARRYIKAMLVSQSTNRNYYSVGAYSFLTFASIVEEIIAKQENDGITTMQEIFTRMIKETNEIKHLFQSGYPLFKEADEMGRPIGVLLLDEENDYIDVKKILDYGLQKFPWLCIFRVAFAGQYNTYFASEIIPVDKILEDYGKFVDDGEGMFKIMHEEVKRFKE